VTADATVDPTWHDFRKSPIPDKAICRRLHRKQPESDGLLFSGHYEESAIALNLSCVPLGRDRFQLFLKLTTR
jgi:hypothetical protein